MISGFDRDASAEAPFAVDFSAATPLKRHGSTCDAFECTVQRRRVFVKRLKAEYRENPLYRAAFDKEFDLGVSLSHPSLPRYIGFGGDYIVMDFIEGDTLADLIRRKDRRLRERKFVDRLLRELVDVVDYLHNRNIVHCDIKADNVIISPYPGRPAMLIDFDKAYSPWLGSTHGSAAKYGCDGCADGAIDFKGVGLIANQLGKGRFAAACNKDDASADGLRKVLAGRRKALVKSTVWAIPVALILVAAMFIGRRYDPAPADRPDVPGEIEVAEVDSMEVDSKTVPAAAAWESAADFEVIVGRYYDPLVEQQAYLRALVADSTVSAHDLQGAFTVYAEAQLRAQGRIIGDAMKQYKLSNPMDVHPMLGQSRRWGTFMRADAELNALYYREIDARRAKESQRSSALPVSLPDTLPADTLHAPRR